MRFEFENLAFSDKGGRIRVTFLSIYYFYLDREELETLGNFSIGRNHIEFESRKKESNLEQKFSFILSRGFSGMKSAVNGKPALYIHRNSGIPLIGSTEFGIIDRGTNTIEIKPITTCNIDCIFCSVDHTKRFSDIVVEKDYLVDELKKVIRQKEHNVNIHIGSQGDSSLYADLEGLVADIKKIEKVTAISMVTNGILITKERADRLAEAGMTHFHFSLHTLNQEMADKLANAKYPVDKVMEVCRHIASNKKAHLLLVPVWVPGINDKDVEDVILFAKEIGANIGVQNFLEYRFGKKPGDPMPMEIFYDKLKSLEKKLGCDLTTLSGDLVIRQDTKLQKPFRKDEVIEAEIIAPDRMKNTVIAAAKGRAISIINCQRHSGKIKIRIIRDKDNIFVAAPLN